MAINAIPGFKALAMKEAAQARVRAEMENLTPEEKLRYLQESVEHGPFGDWFQRIRSRPDTTPVDDRSPKVSIP